MALTASSGASSSHRGSEASELASASSSNCRRSSGLDDTERPLAPERERARQEQISRRLECANLRLSHIRLVGREQEAASQNNIDEDGPGKGLVLISGVSGCGKSRLASTLSDRVEKGGGLFVQGKYDLFFRDEPYFGIGHACSEIVRHLLQLKERGNERFEGIRTTLRGEQIGDELHLLTNTIPLLEEVLGERIRPPGGTSNSNLEQSKEQFYFAFRQFIRIVSDGQRLVVVLDDLQWADAASIELIEWLLTDRESSGLIIVGCYRSDEVPEGHILRKAVTDMKRSSGSHHFSITELELGMLSVSDVNAILMELLSIDNEDASMPLAQLCHGRCMGNPFHLLQFLRVLEDERFLSFDVGTFSWAFDVHAIEQKTAVTSNIVGMVTSRLGQLPSTLKEVLRVAACLGSSFHSEMLRLVWSEMKGKEALDQLDTSMETAVEERIFESNGDATRYRWSHDKVQEAATMLGREEPDCALQFEVGVILLEKHLDDSAIFVIANLLQCGTLKCCNLSRLDEKQRVDIAHVNLVAARTAVSCSAFKSAAKWAKNGIALLPAHAFKVHYDLALELHSIGAEMEGFIGNDADMTAYCNAVVHNARNTLDKMRCYNIQLSRLAYSKQGKLAYLMCMDILGELGCNIPRNSISQTAYAVLALKSVKEISDEALHSLPTMSDPTLLARIGILRKLSTFALFCGEKFVMIIAACRMYDLSLKNGLCPLSTSAFTFLAVVRCALGDVRGGTRLADQALSLLSRFEDSKSELSHTLMVVYFMIKPWTVGYASCRKHLHQSYKVGLECGDTESGALAICSYLIASFFGGTDLRQIVADVQRYLPQVKDLGRDEQADRIAVILQACQCLMGQAADPTEMSGKAIADAHDYEQRLLQQEGTNSAHAIFQAHRGFLMTVFGEHEQAAALALKRGNEVFRTTAGSPSGMWDTFVRGLSLYEMARRTGRTKYRRAANKALSSMRKWAKLNNPDISSKCFLLEAEQFALNRNKARAPEMYEKSVTLAVRCGVLSDAALASERYAEYLLRQGCDGKAVIFFEKAMRSYDDWGATAKVEQLHEKYSGLSDSLRSTVPENIEIRKSTDDTISS
ncbi:hypothetical protein ACHAXT_012198 [Thalassiosira profunda]